MFGFDLIHVAIIVIGMLLSGGAALLVRLQFARGKHVELASGLAGHQVAERILRDAGINDVTVHEHEGFLSDHYNPTNKTLHLSPDVYHGTHAAAAGVAAHEVGHALQHAQGDVTMWGRTILVYPAHFGSAIAPWLVIIGIAMGSAQQIAAGHQGAAYWLAVGGVMLFGIATVCSLVIVFNEFNASARAREHLVHMGIIRNADEQAAVRGVLTAAGLTYVAAAATSLMMLVYWAWRAGLLGGGQRRE